MPRVRSCNWVFTVNNYDSCPLLPDNAKYLTYGFEVGDSGTPHLQGFIFYKNAVAMPKSFLPTAHWEPMRGSQAQAIDYCHKDGDFIELGTRPLTPIEKGDKEKRRYKDAFEAAKIGDFDSIPEDILWRHYNTAKKIRHDYTEDLPDLSHLDNKWVWGPSGTGKSRWARDNYPGAFIKNQNKWWCGYKGQDAVIIDDIHPTWTGKAALKNWADHYPFNAESKGSTAMIRPKHIIVTSNYTPEEIFTDEQDLEPIRRRFHVIHKYEPFKKPMPRSEQTREALQ